MDAKNFEYLSKKVTRYEQLQQMKSVISKMQELLVKDNKLKITVDCDGIHYHSLSEDLPMNVPIEEHDELMRKIKDNLIDSIGMKIVEINDKMEEL